jgi:hypothetical protein
MRIPSTHFALWEYISKLRIPVNPFQNKNRNSVYYFDERHIPSKRTVQSNFREMTKLVEYWNTHFLEKNDTRSIAERVEECSAFRTNDHPAPACPTDEKFAQTMNSVATEVSGPNIFDHLVKNYDHLSFRHFLLSKGWNEKEIVLFAQTSAEESLLNLNAVEVIGEFISKAWDDQGYYEYSPQTIAALRETKGSNPTILKNANYIVGLHEISGGMDQLTRYFIEARPAENTPCVKDVINYGLEVVQLHTKPDPNTGKVTLTCKSSAGYTQVVDADYVVLTTPFTCLRDIAVDPPFSCGKQTAIRELAYGPTGKIMLQYSERWWKDKQPDNMLNCPPVRAPHDGGPGASTTLPIRQVCLTSSSSYATR